jgi:adenylyltransferase/sulfurtransferase
MGEMDYKLLNMRKSCALLSRDEMLTGKVPTTPTTAAVIAGIQVQEAIKHLHGKETLNGEGFVFNGLTHDSYKVSYTRDEECLSHDTYEDQDIVEWEKPSSETTLHELLERAKSDLGEYATLEFEREVLRGFTSPSTGEFHENWISLGAVKEGDAWNPEREEMMRPEMLHGVNGSEDFLDRKVSECGIPPYDVISGKSGLDRKHYIFKADRELVLAGF